MDTVRFEKKQVRMVAHRGVSGLECENTAAAFIAAGNRSHWGIETDVHVTKDGKFVVIHDDQTGRVSDVDIPVEESTWEELSRIRLYANVKQQTPTRQDLVLPTLEDYIRICSHYDKTAVLELKRQMEPEHIAGIVEQIRQLGYLEKTLFISFSWENMICLRALLPEQPMQFLVGKDRWTDDLPEKLKRYRMGLDIHYAQLTEERVALLHEMGIEVNCWTVDDPEIGRQLTEMGVDYITSNILE